MATVKECGFDFCKSLINAGFPLPDNTKRVVIDCNTDSVVTVYYETYASKDMLDVVVESLMKNKSDIEIVEVH